jgi:hypothetical protein
MRYAIAADFDVAPPPFQCSPGFVAAFKTCHRQSSRKIHSKRRTAMTGEQRADWLGWIRAVIEILPAACIINYEETSWLLHPKDILTWAELGYQAVQAKINGDDNDCITTAACVTTAGKSYGLLLLRQEKRHALRNRKLAKSMDIDTFTPKASGISQKRLKATRWEFMRR